MMDWQSVDSMVVWVVSSVEKLEVLTECSMAVLVVRTAVPWVPQLAVQMDMRWAELSAATRDSRKAVMMASKSVDWRD
jgi:hypothetical protein